MQTGPQTGVLHPTIDGGLHVIDADGTISTYDQAGDVVGTLATGASSPDTVALDPSGTRLALGSADTDRIIIADLSSGTIDAVPGVSGASTLGFNTDGSAVVMSLRDGTIRLYDTGGGAVVTVFVGLRVGGAAEPGWYDAATDSIWMSTDDGVVEVLLDAELWADRACGVVARDFTQTEWDLYVPGDRPLRPVCGEGT